jgi:molybdopterin-guanine dinucleotide biosynthesis protein A
MGRDKAELELDGRRLVEHAIDALQGVASTILIASGARARFRELGHACVLDPIADAGPLAGLVAGLTAARTPWIVALACDMPRARTDVLAALLERAARDDLDAALFATDRGVEPLCAVYSRRSAHAAREALALGERRMTAFHAGRDGARKLAIASFGARELGLALAASDAATNVNTPEELANERDRARSSAEARST